MRKFYKIALGLISVTAILFFSSREALTKSNGSPLANTGSPGDGLSNTCAKGGCHVGMVNAFPGSVTIDASEIPSSGYAPGIKYRLVVTVAEAGRNTFGFQLTAEDRNNNKIGSYIATQGVRLEFTDWVTHSINSGTGVWNVDWVAPFATEDVTFYAAGNAANGDGSASKDHIFTGSLTISRDVLASVNSIKEESTFDVYNIFNNKSLIVKSKRKANFRIYSIDGQYVKSFNVDHGKTKINLIDLQGGSYILLEAKGEYSKRFIIN